MQNPVQVAQLEMQRHFGRCILRLQQYERLLKAMIATMSLSGNPEELAELQAQQFEDVRALTLGALVRLFARDYLVDNERHVEASDTSDDSILQVENLVSFRISYSMAMSSEDYKRTVDAMTELRDMRNELVHHFIEQFDISDEAGCLAGTLHLQTCFTRIDDHLSQLSNWAKTRDEVRRHAHSFFASKEFEELLAHATTEDAPPTALPIFEWLRRAEVARNVAGWTQLDDAVVHIVRAHGAQTPALYGSRTWRELLEKSGQFETRRVKGSSTERGRTWFRSNTAPASQRTGNSASNSTGNSTANSAACPNSSRK